MREGARILVVEPAATGGLHAHVDDELSVLAALAVHAERADVRILPRPDPRTDAATVRALRRAAASGEWDAIHAHGLRAGALAGIARLGIRCRWAVRRGTDRRGIGTTRRDPRRRGLRLVTTLHNRTTGSRPARVLGGVLLAVVARTADVVLGVSPDLVDSARRAGAREARLAVIPAHPPGASAPAVQPRAAAPAAQEGDADDGADGTLQVLVLARLAPQKDLPTLLDAAAVLESSAPGTVRIRVAGDGPLHGELAAEIARRELPVELLGRREDVPALLSVTDVVVSSSIWEGQPVGLQEALHAGCAIVATDAGGTRAVTGAAAALVGVGDAPGLAREIARLRDPTELARARAAARQRAAQLPTDADLAAQLLDVLVTGPDRQ